jgi:hypothetical protein
MAVQTFTLSPNSIPTIAGTNATIDELLAAFNSHIATNGVWWAVSDFNAGNHTLELKRKVSTSPTGAMATVRILLFGGVSPNAAALAPQSSAPVSTALYVGASVDANTTGPTTLPTVGAPYSTQYMQATRMCSSTDIPAANQPRIYMLESEEMIILCVACTTGWATYIGGKMINRLSDNTLLFGNMPSGGLIAIAPTPSTLGQVGSAFPVTCHNDAATNDFKASYWTGSAVRQFGRQNGPIGALTPGTNQGLGEGTSQFILPSMILLDSAQLTNQGKTPLGMARQLRFGPNANARTELQESAVTTAIHVQAIGVAPSIGLWVDQQLAAAGLNY